MKVTWIGPGNLVMGEMLIPPGCVEAQNIEMSDQQWASLNDRQKAKFDHPNKPKPKPKVQPKPKAEKLPNK